MTPLSKEIKLLIASTIAVGLTTACRPVSSQSVDLAAISALEQSPAAPIIEVLTPDTNRSFKNQLSTATPTMIKTTLLPKLADQLKQQNMQAPAECTPSSPQWHWQATSTPVGDDNYTPRPPTEDDLKPQELPAADATRIAEEKERVRAWKDELISFIYDKFVENYNGLKDATQRPIAVPGKYVYVPPPTEFQPKDPAMANLFSDGTILSQLDDMPQSVSYLFFVNGKTGEVTAAVSQSAHNYEKGGKPMLVLPENDLPTFGPDTFLVDRYGIETLLVKARGLMPGETDENALVVSRLYEDLNGDGFPFTSCDIVNEKMAVTAIFNPATGKWVEGEALNSIIFHYTKR